MKYIKTKDNFIKENKSYQLNEGQFSWMTHDTNDQIGSERLNNIIVYMYDNEGNKWKETKYDGYGNFGGMDYYDLVATMNGYDADRQKGIDLAFGKLKTKDKKRKTLFPALVTDPRYNWKRHDFTQEADSDPNQSWYQEEEEYDDYYESVVTESVEESESAEKGLKAIPAVLSWDIEQFLKKQKDAKKLTKGSFTDLVQALHSRGFEDRLNGANLRNWQDVVKKHIKESVVTEGGKEIEKNIKDIEDGDVIVVGRNKHFKVDYIDPWKAGGRILVGKDVKTGKKGKMKVKFLTPRGNSGLADDTILMVLAEAIASIKSSWKGTKGWNDVARVMDAGLMKAVKAGSVTLGYAKDYVKSLERMAKRNAKKFFADYGDFTEDDFIEDVRYNMANEKVNEGRASADRLLKDVINGNTSEVEGIKLSKDMAQGFADWLRYSTYGKKFGSLPFDKLFTAAFNWGLDRFVKGANTKVKDEFKELKAKAKEMRKAEMKGESLTEGKGDKAVSMAQKKLDKVMVDLKTNLLKFKGAKTDVDKETFKTEAGRLTQLRKDAQENLEQAIQDAYADVDLVVMENYDTEQRKEMASKGLALPDGSFPIKNLEDLKNAIQAYGRAKDQAAAAKFIAKRAKALSAEDLIPDTEDFQKALKEASFGRIPKFGK